MIINVIATGSSGNLYELIDEKGNSIILEAGVPRYKFVKYRDGGDVMPEMCIITHGHSDHAKFANEYRMICPVHKSPTFATSENFRALGFEVKHGDILNYAYLIKLVADNDFLFFATDLEWDDEKFESIFRELQNLEVRKFLIECNYNDYLYHVAMNSAIEDRPIGNDNHFSDNDVVNFVRKSKAVNPRIITIHGSNKLSANIYTKKYISGKLPTSKVAVAIGGKNGVKNLYQI